MKLRRAEESKRSHLNTRANCTASDISTLGMTSGEGKSSACSQESFLAPFMSEYIYALAGD